MIIGSFITLKSNDWCFKFNTFWIVTQWVSKPLKTCWERISLRFIKVKLFGHSCTSFINPKHAFEANFQGFAHSLSYDSNVLNLKHESFHFNVMNDPIITDNQIISCTLYDLFTIYESININFDYQSSIKCRFLFTKFSLIFSL